MKAMPAITLVQTIAQFPRAMVLLFKLPLYESYESETREGPVFFQRYRCVFPSGSEVPGGFFGFLENHELSSRMGQTNLPKFVYLCKCHALRNPPQSMRLRRKQTKLLSILTTKKTMWYPEGLRGTLLH